MADKNDAIRVLIVDDELDIREGSERILKRIGYRVHTAARGDDALAYLEKNTAAIVLLDLKMPGIDGMEVLARVREMEAVPLVIVITGYATVETAIKAMKQGAYDFIPKPFEPEQLRIVVNRAAEKIRLTREAEILEREKVKTLSDLDMEKSRIRTIIEALPDGVLVTNNTGKVVLMNPAFRQLFSLEADAKSGEQIEAYVPDESFCSLVMDISRGKYIDYGDIPDHEFSLTNEKYLRARGQPVLGEKKECLGAVVNFVDITAMKVLDRLKSEFVAKVSHELRSPLATIHEQIALVLKDMVHTAIPEEQNILSRAKEKTQGLISMIGDLLDLSNIEEGLVCHEPQPVRLGELLQDIVDFLGSRAESKGQSLLLQLPADPLPPITTDPLALESIFGNLIANAINYTSDGGKIRVTMELAGINIVVKVIDNGFGIADQYIDRIFERFYRVKDEKTRYITGTGLGLPIVKGLVDSLGGMIHVDSTPGEGSIFSVLLPTMSGQAG